jgi:hypothetical protein
VLIVVSMITGEVNRGERGVGEGFEYSSRAPYPFRDGQSAEIGKGSARLRSSGAQATCRLSHFRSELLGIVAEGCDVCFMP